MSALNYAPVSVTETIILLCYVPFSAGPIFHVTVTKIERFFRKKKCTFCQLSLPLKDVNMNVTLLQLSSGVG